MRVIGHCMRIFNFENVVFYINRVTFIALTILIYISFILINIKKSYLYIFYAS